MRDIRLCVGEFGALRAATRRYARATMERFPAVTELVSLASISPERVEALLDRAFGAERHVRTAYRVREGVAPIDLLSLASIGDDGSLSGSVQAWPIVWHGDSGIVRPMIMVGPVAVEPTLQQAGIGQALMHALLERASRSGEPGADALMLIGDPEYYGRFFGFTDAHTSGWRLPGPVERHRLLARGDSVPAGTGVIAPRVRIAA